MERWQRILQKQLFPMPTSGINIKGDFMKFERLILYNFMRYKGRNELEFSCDEQKNVTVVLGDNTVGKTTIAQAFRFGLYGEIQIEAGKSKEDYQLLNNEVMLSMDSNARESVFVEIMISNEEKCYQIHREIAYIRKCPSCILVESYKKKSLSFSENHGVLKEIQEEEMESVIQEMFPKDLAGYFLFDGEKWNSGNLGGIRENIKESVHKLTGLSSAEKAMFHIQDMGRNSAIGKMKAKISGGGAIYDSIRADIDKYMAGIEGLEKKLETDKKNIMYYENEIKKIEEFLLNNESTETMQKRYKGMEQLCIEKQKNIESEYKNLMNYFSETIFLYCAIPMVHRSVEIMKKADMEQKDIPYMKQATIDYLIQKGECICGTKITNGSEAYQHLVDQRKFLPPASIGLLLNDFEKIAYQWKTKGETVKERIEELALEISKAQESFEKTYNQYIEFGKKLDTSCDFGEKRMEQKRLETQKNSYLRSQGEHEGRIQSLKENIARQEKELSSLELKNAENRRWRNRVEVGMQLYQKIATDYRRKEKEVFNELNKRIQSNFSQMFNAKDKKIILDEKYNIKMMYQAEHGYTEEKNLSEGEKIARNFAFITTIMEYNAEKKKTLRESKGIHTELEPETLPIVLDGPFSKLGAENIALIAKILPKIADQVIIFMLEKDWEYTELESYVGSRYRIEKEKEAKSASLRRCSTL